MGEQVFEEPRRPPLWGVSYSQHALPIRNGRGVSYSQHATHFGNLIFAYCMITITTRQGGNMVHNANDFGDIAKIASNLITAIHNTTRSGDSSSQTVHTDLRNLLNTQGSLVADLRKLAEWCDDIYYANVIASTK